MPQVRFQSSSEAGPLVPIRFTNMAPSEDRSPNSRLRLMTEKLLAATTPATS